MFADQEFMRRALSLAERGRGWVNPNPMVGCVIVHQGVLIAEGWHERVGAAHAEAMACARLSPEVLRESVVYVTLEPCAHQGRTAPCVDLFLNNPPKRMVIAMEDPNPKVAGRGIEKLREAGIPVEVGLLEKEAMQLNEIFVKYMRTGLPWVTAKCAMTLDGKIATHSGHSRWITSVEARQATHALRHSHDGIMVGSRTVLCDKPQLTTRLEGREGRNPIRIVLDDDGILEGNEEVFQDRSEAPVWVVGTKKLSWPFADKSIVVPKNDSGVDMLALMKRLGEEGVTSILIEGGGETLSSAFFGQIVDKLCFFVAPKIIGGRDAVTAVEGNGVDHMSRALQMRDLQCRSYGPDLCMEAYVDREKSFSSHEERGA